MPPPAEPGFPADPCDSSTRLKPSPAADVGPLGAELPPALPAAVPPAIPAAPPGLTACEVDEPSRPGIPDTPPAPAIRGWADVPEPPIDERSGGPPPAWRRDSVLPRPPEPMSTVAF